MHMLVLRCWSHLFAVGHEIGRVSRGNVSNSVIKLQQHLHSCLRRLGMSAIHSLSMGLDFMNAIAGLALQRH